MARVAQPRIDQEPSLLRQQGIPIALVLAGSLTTLFPMIATTAILPPFGLLFMLSWRSLHRDLWPVWMPLFLGAFDDLFSGQPIGSAMLLWTTAFLIMDATDKRFVWRDFWQEWTLAAGMITLVLTGGLAIANMTGGNTPLLYIIPQTLITICLFPLTSRICAALDKRRF
jgi:rod shape-determining protein MreD